jgi:Cu(I)/Ag(I) efflux system membrane fusion protein/cobalt-zinc-cadmium efflux system membrane fusion protein
MSRGLQAFALVVVFVLGAVLAALVIVNPLGVSLPGATSRQPEGEREVTAHSEVALDENAPQLYQCSMHPEVIENEPEDCPVCGMRLMPMDRLQRSDEVGEPGDGEREVLYWYAPMDSTYIRDEPGLSPMGMELVPKFADEVVADKPGVIRIDPVQVQNIGVVSVAAEIGDISRMSRTVGILDFNSEHITWINTKFEGWIERVHVNYVGQEVHKGQALFEIYSPELVTTQDEYLRALEYRESLQGSTRSEALRQADSLVRSTRDRLRYWDIADQQIDRLESSREVQRLLTVTSPADGVVAEIMSEALEGMFVEPGMDLYKIADLSTVWVHADIYELDIPWIRRGLPAEVSFRNDPQNRFSGEILFLYPEVSRDTRTLKICIEVPNQDGRLRPGMYADVVVKGPWIRGAVVVPQSAVIRSGERNIMFVDLGSGRFEPRDVELGIKGEGDRIQIRQGVEAGERVVTQAQFMLDSESRTQEAVAKYRARKRDEATAP